MIAQCQLNVALLHDGMLNKGGELVTTSLTLIDLHDIARSCTTFGVEAFYVAHSSPHLRSLARKLFDHWQSGFGSTYNPNRREAIERVDISVSLDEVLLKIERRSGKPPILVATSAREEGSRVTFSELRERLRDPGDGPFLLLLGTGWGMSPELIDRTDIFLEPIRGVGKYNHLSVRSACAIMLSRLMEPW